MKLAIVAGGWHWPLHFFETAARQAPGADLFAIAHRNPELPVVREEKREILRTAVGPLADLDRELYHAYPTVAGLRALGWAYSEEPNTVGDWGFFNQWLATHDYRQYDVILNCHDDTFLFPPPDRFPSRDRKRAAPFDQPGADLFDQLSGDWFLLANGRYPQAPPAYVRGSFEFWKPELLDLLGGRIDLGDIRLTREGKTDTPAGLGSLSEWNNTGTPLRNFLVRHGLQDRVAYLSPYYRISPWAIEAERGFLHFQDGAPWSFEDGIREFLPSAREVPVS